MRLSAMACRGGMREIAHGVGSYNIAIPRFLLATLKGRIHEHPKIRRARLRWHALESSRPGLNDL